MSYTAEEVSKAKELFRKQGGTYPKTPSELIEALQLLLSPDKKVQKELCVQK